MAVALIENIQREDLTPAEEARALQRLIVEFQLTHEAVGQAVGRSRAAVSNLIRLLDLPENVVALIDAKQLSMGHARALLGLEAAAEQVRLARVVAERGLSVRETEELVRRTLKKTGAGRGAAQGRPELAVVSEVLRTANVRVELQQKASGTARIVIDVAGPVERDAILESIRGAVEHRRGTK